MTEAAPSTPNRTLRRFAECSIPRATNFFNKIGPECRLLRSNHR